MKLTITFKDPDSPYEAMQEAVTNEVAKISDLDGAEQESLVDRRVRALQEQLNPWIRYGEYVCIEFDTDAGTATVKPAQR